MVDDVPISLNAAGPPLSPAAMFGTPLISLHYLEVISSYRIRLHLTSVIRVNNFTIRTTSTGSYRMIMGKNRSIVAS